MQGQPKTNSEFDKKRVLVTGGTRGIGEAIVARLVRGGATVIATARSAPPKNTSDKFIQADISTREGVDRVEKAVMDRLGQFGDDNFVEFKARSDIPCLRRATTGRDVEERKRRQCQFVGNQRVISRYRSRKEAISNISVCEGALPIKKPRAGQAHRQPCERAHGAPL